MIHILLKISLIHIIQQFIESMDLHGSWDPIGFLDPWVPALPAPGGQSAHIDQTQEDLDDTHEDHLTDCRDHLMDLMGSRIRGEAMGNQRERTKNWGTLHDSHIAIFMGTRLFKIIWGQLGHPMFRL